jgi:hypothetical protein
MEHDGRREGDGETGEARAPSGAMGGSVASRVEASEDGAP